MSAGWCRLSRVTNRPTVPPAWVDRIDQILTALPQCQIEDAWTGVRWRVASATVAHVFGGEDRLFRIMFRAEPGEVMAFEHLGEPYFRAEWGENVVGVLLDERTDWDELAELLTDSYCVQAPGHLAATINRPE